MSASIEIGQYQRFVHEPAQVDQQDRLPIDGSHAWLGALLVLASAIVTIRGLCWVAAQVIRALH